MFFFPGPPDLATASTWNSESVFARNMPDVTDVGPRQYKHLTKNQSYNESKIKKIKSKEVSNKIIKSDEAFSVPLKNPAKEAETCDALQVVMMMMMIIVMIMIVMTKMMATTTLINFDH